MHKNEEASEMLVTTPILTTSVMADFPCQHRYIFLEFFFVFFMAYNLFFLFFFRELYSIILLCF